MKKLFSLFFCFFASGPLWAAAAAGLPDDVYFRAMKDEMKRTLKELHTQGSPKPYYVAYKLQRQQSVSRAASFGKMYPLGEEPYDSLSVFAVFGLGSDKSDQLGFKNENYRYEPSVIRRAPQSYEGIRRALWWVGDSEYRIASDTYLKKQAYKRQKHLDDSLPDVTPAPQAVLIEDVPETVFPEETQIEKLLEKLSAKGKDAPYVENFTARLWLARCTNYYLNSLGGAYRTSRPEGKVIFEARLRNRDGYIQETMEEVSVADWAHLNEEELEKKADAFLARLDEMHRAKKAEAYLGPVLLKPAAAAGFVWKNFVWNMENVKPLLSSREETDYSAGDFRDKKGMRVISNVVDVYDKPNLREYKGEPLAGFMPVDDEGVAAQDLTLTSLGRLRALPLSRRPVKEGHQSNGHARTHLGSYPREALTNVFVEAKNPLTPQALEEEFLAMCRDWELEYCYEVEELDNSIANRAWRVYAEDGRKEPVFGLDLQHLSTRSLRDIAAAGDDARVFDFLRSQSVVVPSLLLEEAEVLATETKPDRKPFVPKP